MASTVEKPVPHGYVDDGPELAIVDRVNSPDQLRQTLKRQRAVSTMKLGTRLLELKLITNEQLNAALQVQNTDSRRHLGEILFDLGLVSKRQLDQVLCEKLGIPLIELAQFKIEPEVLRLLPEDLVRQSGVLPLCRIEGKLVVAVSDPLDSEPLERVRFRVQTPVIPVMAPREEIEQAIRIHYKTDASLAQPLSRVIKVDTRRFEADRDATPLDELDSSVVRLVNKIVIDAHASGASDIHVDASSGTQQVSVRFRTGGVLSEYTRLPGTLRAAIATRIKTMAGIDISERRRPQEGRIDAVDNGPANLQLRVITVPTCDGNEDIAIKLVSTRELLPLDKLGMSTEVAESVKQLAALPEGLLLIAGPARSGTTTTAYAVLELIDAADRKIWTVENRVEQPRSAWSQIEANAKTGSDYASILDTAVRADPDVVMVGEMRNREAVALAVEAALNHSLVVAAMRGNSAAEACSRVLDMGVDAFSFADVFVGVIAQRLARRLCASCHISRPLTPSELEGLIQEYCQGTQLRPTQVRVEWTQRYGSALEIHGAKGCELCAGTGYHGHVGLYELLRAGPAMRSLVTQRRPANELAAAGMQGGMRTLKQDGIDKALAGLSDMREIRAVTV